MWLLSLLFAGLPGSGVGGEVSGLYEAGVPVMSRAVEERAAAFGIGLLQVITKVSGARNSASNPTVGAALAEPGRFVQQFQYRQTQTGLEASSEQSALSLWAKFDPRVVDGLIRDAGLPVWGRIRPSVVAWFAIEQDAGRELLGTDDPSGLASVLHNSASVRGLSFVLPLLDLEDRARIGVADVWAGFWDTVDAASVRYQSEGRLTARVYPVLPTLWEARWHLSLADGAHEWVSQADLVEVLLEDGVNEVADILAARYAGHGFDQGLAGVVLEVVGVATLEDYARTVSYLGSLDEVSKVKVTEVSPASVGLYLDARGGRDALKQVVALGTTLIVEDSNVPNEVLRFRLLP